MSFGLSTAPFLFDLFAEAFHWMLVSFLRWEMEHYLDDIISVFSGSSSSDDLQRAAHDYVRLTTILGIPRKDSKNECGTTVSVFGIEIDMLAFVARLPPDKLQRAIDYRDRHACFCCSSSS